MADKPINEVVEVDAVLDALSSPTSSDVYEAVEPYSNAAVAAAAAKRALAGGGGSSAVLMHSTTLSSADLLDLHNTAVELLPAPGGRFYYDVQHIVWHYRPGATPYAGSFDDLVLGFYPAGAPFPDYNPSAAVSTFVVPSFSQSGYHVLEQTEDVYLYKAAPLPGNDGLAWLASAIENKPLSAGLQNVQEAPDPVVPWTNGNGTVTLRVFYSLINGAPA